MDKARNIKISNRRRIHPREQTTRMSCVLNRWMLKLFRKERAVGLACRILTAAVSDIPISWSCGRGWLTSVRVARGVSTSPSAKCHMSQTSEIGSTLYLQGGRYRGSSEPRQTIKPPPHLQRLQLPSLSTIVWKRAFPFLDFWVRATCSFAGKGTEHTSSSYISLCDLPDKLRGCCN